MPPEEIAGAAPAASEPIAAPEAVTTHEQVVQAQEQPPERAATSEKIDEPKPSKTARDSIDKAFEAVEKAEQGDRERDEKGRFVAKAADEAKKALLDVDPNALDKPKQPIEAKPVIDTTKPALDAPGRFTDAAKAAWKDAPEPVKAEVHRALTEMSNGIQQYREIFEPLKPFYERARDSNIPLHEAIGNYVRIETALQQNPEAGIAEVLAFINETPQSYAAKVLGQAPDQARVQSEQTILALKQEIAGLKGEMQKIGSSFQEQAQQREIAQAKSELDTFSKAAGHERMADNAFARQVGQIMQAGLAPSLSDAYAMAERLNPAPQQASVQQAQPAKQPDPAQTRKGLSVTGAPASGSNPVNRKPAPTRAEAIDRAFASVGYS